MYRTVIESVHESVHLQARLVDLQAEGIQVLTRARFPTSISKPPDVKIENLSIFREIDAC